eukprot:m.483658 g.483658  ORF g.483658 m.483658 type:complete len:712 (+) comp23031_c0_seq1:111-2246(+)
MDKKAQREAEKQAKKEAKEREKLAKKQAKAVVPGGQWSVSDVGDWLASIELKEYSGTFKKNKIDGAALLALTTEDLQELGVGVLGHRKKMMAGIEMLNARLRGQRPPQAGGPPGQPGRPGGPPPQQQAVPTIGLIARNIGGKVHVFDQESGEEVFDIPAHQRAMHAKLAAQQQGGVAPGQPGGPPGAPGQPQPGPGAPGQPQPGPAGQPQQQPPPAVAAPDQDMPPPRPAPMGGAGPAEAADMAPPPPRPAPMGAPGTPELDRGVSIKQAPGVPSHDLTFAPVGAPAQPSDFGASSTDDDAPPPPRPSKPQDDVAEPKGVGFPGQTESMRRAPPPAAAVQEEDIHDRVEPHLRSAPWYQPNTPIDQALASLAGHPNGSFLVVNDLDDNLLALLYVEGGVVRQNTIALSQRGLHLEGVSGTYFSGLDGLVQYYAGNNEERPYMLSTSPGAEAPSGSRPAERPPAAAQPPPTSAVLPEEPDPDEHWMADWYYKDTPKEKALEMIEFEPDGSFLVRDSRSEPGCFALSYVFQGNIFHKLIETTAAGLRFKHGNNFHNTLTELINFFMATKGDELKCILVPPRAPTDIREHRTETLKHKQSTIKSMTVAPMGPPPVTTSGRQNFAWNCVHLSRDQALLQLTGRPLGAFIIRASDKSHAALSMVSPTGLYHMHIEKGGTGLHLRKAGAPSFRSMEDLIGYYAKPQQADLPCNLMEV